MRYFQRRTEQRQTASKKARRRVILSRHASPTTDRLLGKQTSKLLRPLLLPHIVRTESVASKQSTPAAHVNHYRPIQASRSKSGRRTVKVGSRQEAADTALLIEQSTKQQQSKECNAFICRKVSSPPNERLIDAMMGVSSYTAALSGSDSDPPKGS